MVLAETIVVEPEDILMQVGCFIMELMQTHSLVVVAVVVSLILMNIVTIYPSTFMVLEMVVVELLWFDFVDEQNVQLTLNDEIAYSQPQNETGPGTYESEIVA